MRDQAKYADWIAVDWGTTNLRAWAMSRDNEILAEARSDEGMGSLRKDQFEPALLALIEPWLGIHQTQVLACGMVGSRQGWAEASYRPVPTHVYGGATKVACKDPRLNVSVLPGISQTDPADVMRGEETQIAGFSTATPEFDGVLCLPGTHSKWARISAEEVVSFQTFMTGELFDLLAEKSVLRHSVTGSDWDDQSFADAVSEALSRPEALAARLFNLRAKQLLDGQAQGELVARLSGLLIGAELAAAKPYWLGQDVAVIGDPKLTALYAQALGLQGLSARQVNGDDMTLAGLIRVQKELGLCPET
ncbi:MAG: 2-dehydro-3-deoxygalactonokinase [Pseudomonadota bacterium]